MKKEITIKLSSPTSADLSITQDCNHRCIHCYNPWRLDHEDNCTTAEKHNRNITKVVEELKANDIWRVTLTGGEPLSDMDFLLEIFPLLKANNIEVGMNSNLTLMDDQKATRLKELGWDSTILTSLPGLSKKTCDQITQINGSFSRILKGINICNAHNIAVGVNIVVSKANIDDIDLLYDFVREYNIQYVSITRAIAPTYDLENSDFYLNESDMLRMANVLLAIHNEQGILVGSVTPFPLCILKDLKKYEPIISATCAAGVSRCSIDATTGSITACTHEEAQYGNLYEDGMKKAWDKMGIWRCGKNLNPECHDCRLLPLCGGECRMISGHESYKQYALNKNAQITVTPPPEIKSEEFSKNTVFQVSQQNTRMRAEEFGGIVRHGSNECYVSHSVFSLTQTLLTRESWTLNELLEWCEDSPEFYNAIRSIQSIGVLIK